VTAPAGAAPGGVTSAGGSIYDLGYRGYDGPRLGRVTVLAGLLRQTLKEAFGIGRGGRAKIAPFILLALAVFPAVLAVAFRALAAQAGAGEQFEQQVPIRHDTYEGTVGLFVMLFVAAQAPELFGRDQRYGVLPLYFSRVLTRIDYALARMGGLFLAILIITVVPQLVLTLGTILAASDPVTGIGKDLPEIPRYLAVSLVQAGVYTGIGSLVAAHTPRRAYAVAAIIAVFIVPPIVVGIFAASSGQDTARILQLLSPSDVVDGVNSAVFGPIRITADTVIVSLLDGRIYVLAAAAYIVGSLAIVIRRYLTVTV
jgi:ABC-2 type transport system permease protein